MAISNIGICYTLNKISVIKVATTAIVLCTISIDIVNIHVAMYYLTIIYVGTHITLAIHTLTKQPTKPTDPNISIARTPAKITYLILIGQTVL
jgi:hypothetical protein